MIKVGEHITLDIIGTDREYDPSVFEKVINEIAKAANVNKLILGHFSARYKDLNEFKIEAQSNFKIYPPVKSSPVISFSSNFEIFILFLSLLIFSIKT